jgi:IclR family transcriptional regulator, mhp operon transcriptional activator
MSRNGELDSGIRSVSRSLAVLKAINRTGSLTMTDIAAAAEIPYPTAIRIVRTLLDEGMIEREPSRKRYRPTAMVQTLSCGFQNHDRLVVTARPHIVALTAKLGWPISVVTRVAQSMVVRDSTSVLTSLTFSHYYPGWQVPLLASASGRVYFANCDAAERELLLRGFRERPSDVDILTLRDFEEGDAAGRIRAQGYAATARNAYSANPGKTSSVAVALFDGETLLGSLALVFFASAISVDEAIRRFLQPLRDTAEAIGSDMGAASDEGSRRMKRKPVTSATSTSAQQSANPVR